MNPLEDFEVACEECGKWHMYSQDCDPRDVAEMVKAEREAQEDLEQYES